MRRQGKKLAQVARIQARGQLYIPAPGKPDEPEDEFDQALAAFGLQQGDGEGAEDEAPPPDTCYLWPCNVAAFNLWQRVQTQWREGMQGRSGLDYGSVKVTMGFMGIKNRAQQEMFGSLQAMELAALKVWAEQRD